MTGNRYFLVKMPKLEESLIILVLISAGISDALDCNKVSNPVPTTTNVPPFPNFPPTFQTRVEVNILNKNKTVSAQEYFDNPNNRATLIMQEGGTPVTLIYDYQNNQLFYVKDGICAPTNLTSDENSFLFGDQRIHGIPHLMSTAGALHFMNSSGQVYLGRTTIRGIDVDHYHTCMNWPLLNATFILDYYFTALNWLTASMSQQIPVRAVAQGTSSNNGLEHNFTHIYEYFDFRFDLTVDDEIFETPRGIICQPRKDTKPKPTMPSAYQYRQEIVSPFNDLIQIANVYYDDDYKLVRYDYRNLSPAPPTYSINPLREIHDFNTGVRYIQDLVTGNCSIYPLSNSSFDVLEGKGTFVANGSDSSGYILHLKNSMQFFDLDSNFVYTGQRKARGALCNVFTGIRNYNINGAMTKASFEYYFLIDYWNELPDDSSATPSNIPTMLVVTMLNDDESLGDLQIIYNIIDYDEGKPDISVFDVSRCYGEHAKLQFQIRLPGQFKKSTEDYLLLKSQQILALNMNVYPIRVQDVSVNYDSSNVYISATLLDRTPYAAQFTFISVKKIVRKDDVLYDHTTADQCAKYCVENPNFVCNSYDFCPKLGTGNCRLSQGHVADGYSVLINSTCDHYSRTVNGPTIQEVSLDQAFDKLQSNIFQNLFRIEIFDTDDGSITNYKAVDVQILFGWMNYKPLPSVARQFSYDLEIVFPALHQAYIASIWYDPPKNLVRYDIVNDNPVPPLYDTNPVTTIHDFNTGLAYNIDNVLGNCTINAIHGGAFDTGVNNKNAYVYLKNPLEFFSLNDTFTWAGQRTVRGILCDVFETITTNFKLQAFNGPFTSRLQFFFMSDVWAQVASTGNAPVNSQPVQMIATSEEIGMFITYNLYNFNEQDPDITNFDITPCFPGNQQRDFLIRFPGQYHPYLENQDKIFIQDCVLLLSMTSGASPLRFQKLEVTYDLHYVFVLGTILEQSPFIDDFTSSIGKQYRASSSQYVVSNILSATDCASQCRQSTKFACKGFDYCLSTKQCVVSAQHIVNSTQLVQNPECNHYSRTTDTVVNVQPTIDQSMLKLKNLVYGNGFNITVTTSTKQTVLYMADKIRDGILRSESQDTSSVFRKDFNKIEGSVILLHNDGYYGGISVDDCASKCLLEPTFQCLSFDYCYKTSDCLLSKVHPDQNASLIHSHDFCDLFSRNYLNRYNAFAGMTYSVAADQMLQNVGSVNLCAKACTETSQIQCKSFQYCNKTMSCGLLSTHQLDLPVTSKQASPSCSFYSRKYIDDFQLLNHMQIQSTNYVSFYQTTVTQCAKTCIDMNIDHCKSFVFCKTSNGTICKVTTDHPREGAPVSKTATCDLYARYYFPYPQHTNGSTAVPPSVSPAGTPSVSPAGTPCVYTTGTPYVPPATNTQKPPVHMTTTTSSDNHHFNQQLSSPPTTGYSGGAMAAVGICLFIPGMVVGAAALFFYKRRQEQNKDGEHFDMTSNFTSRVDEE